MERDLKITLRKRGVSCRARLLENDAPQTCAAVWNALPLSGPAFHAKYARDEVYAVLPPFTDHEPALENPTITPIAGDIVYHASNANLLPRSFREDLGLSYLDLIVDLAVFYGRNNLLLNPDLGWVPSTVFATIVENLSEMAAACNDVWRSGSIGEVLEFARAGAVPS
jgi:Protein of unknown function (DUF3830)